MTVDKWLEFVRSLPEGVDIDGVRLAHRQYDAGLLTKEECSRKIKELSGQTFTELEEMDGAELNKNTALLEYIAELKKHYKIGMVSNVATNWIKDYFLTPEEQKLFDVFVFSFEVGVTKPDPKIFQVAFDKLGVSAEECVLVDDVERYCEAAKKQGMQTVCYQDFKQMKRELEAII